MGKWSEKICIISCILRLNLLAISVDQSFWVWLWLQICFQYEKLLVTLIYMLSLANKKGNHIYMETT